MQTVRSAPSASRTRANASRSDASSASDTAAVPCGAVSSRRTTRFPLPTTTRPDTSLVWTEYEAPLPLCRTS